MLRIYEIKLDLYEDKQVIPRKIEKKLRLKTGCIHDWRIVKESVDARHKESIKRIYTVDFDVKNYEIVLKKNKTSKLLDLNKQPVKSFQFRTKDSVLKYETGKDKKIFADKDVCSVLKNRPIIVGFGPCGMFAALWLARAGFKPLILERGRQIEQRIIDVEKFWSEGKLNTVSNVQFGEGGAGAFSDGKLNSGIKSSFRTQFVLEELVHHGASEEILYKQNPHVGTDILRKIVVEMRKEIQSLGGEFRFESKFTGFKTHEGNLSSVEINGNEYVDADTLVIAPGHSARDTFKMLYNIGIELESKPFSIGARIEHPQSMININQYGSEEAVEILGAADYKLSYKCKDGRGVYTFCMCPGGYVVASASEEGGVVTNGMSYHSRSGKNSNSALLVSVNPKDFGGNHPLSGIYFQRKWENAAFKLGGANYFAPVQKIGDFLSGTASICEGTVKPEYRPGVKWTDISKCLPDFAVKAMREALPQFGRKIKGFDMSDGVLTAVETRSSSPVRIIRDKNLQTSVRGIFPAGEGAGYAGGIMSAAVDGIRVAQKICELTSPND